MPDFRSEILKRLRAAGLSQNRLAILSGVPRQSINTYLRGRRDARRTSLSADMVERLLAALEASGGNSPVIPDS